MPVNLVRLTPAELAARNADGDTGQILLARSFRALRAQLNVTAVGGGGSPTLDVKLQDTLDGTNWNDLDAFAQATGITREVISITDPFTDRIRVLWNLGGTGTDEQQTVTITGTPTGGTFTLTYAGQTTGTIAFDAAAATVQTALRALSNIGDSDVTVAGSAGGPYTATFAAALGSQDVAEMTGDGSGLTGGTTPAVEVATTVPGLPPSATFQVDLAAIP